MKPARKLFWAAPLIATLVAAAAGTWAVTAIRRLDRSLTERLSGRPWQIPAKILSDSFPVYPGDHLSPPSLIERLEQLSYQAAEDRVASAGEYRYDRTTGLCDVFLRDLVDAERLIRGYPARIRFRFGRVVGIERADTGEALDSVELGPETLAGIYEEGWEDRRIVRLGELPSKLVYAVLAAEDRRFFEHHGLDTRGILRALAANVRSGKVVQGGSTLTQQLVKNFFLTPARTIRRKMVEAVMALLLERRFSKLEILELYLNEIYMGQRGARGVYGVWEASRFYFDKEPGDLTLGETAMLAGLIKAPGRYAPTRNPELALRRRGEVLAALERAGQVSPEERERAASEPLPERLPTVEATEAPYFVDFVRGELEGRFAEDDLTSQGFRVFTTLDPARQRAAERAVAAGLEALEKARPELAADAGGARVQAALVALEPKSGEVTAMVGGRSYEESQFNRVTQARRQPGSLFKPVVYLAAYEEEERQGRGAYLPTRKLADTPYEWRYDGRVWSPANFGGRYHGEVTLRRALELSLNSATARLANEVGIERVRDLAVRLGFREPPALPSLILGAVEVTPLEVAEAYAAIANLGFRTGALSIRSVLDSDGRPLERSTLRAEQAVSPRVAYLAASLLTGAMERGTGASARAAGLRGVFAGKTGTTNEGRDAWFAGFSPDLVAVVWVGFDEGRPLGLSGSQAALPIWTEFMKAATADRPPTPFLVPAGIETKAIDPSSGKLAGERCPARLEEAFFEGGGPTEPCPLHPAAATPIPP